MKKALLVLLLLAVVGGFTFAQVAPELKIEVGLDTWWVPFQYLGKSLAVTGETDLADQSFLGMGLARDDYGFGTRAVLYFTGGIDTIGFVFQPRFYAVPAGTINFGDHFHVWYKPFGDDMLKITAGKFVDGTLRGKVGDNWMQNFTLPAFANDAIFSQFRNQGFNNAFTTNTGVLITSKIDALYIGLLFPSLSPFSTATQSFLTEKGGKYEVVNSADGFNDIARILERTQIGFGYTIPDIGFARLQIIGANAGISSYANFTAETPAALPVIYAPSIEVAFQLTMVQGLNLDVGFKYFIPIDASWAGEWVREIAKGSTFEPWYKWTNNPANTWEATRNMEASIGAVYVMDDITINFHGNGRFGGSFTTNDNKLDPTLADPITINFPLELNFHLWPEYNLGFATMGLDIGFGYYGAYTVGDTDDVYKSTGKDETGWHGGMRMGFGVYVKKVLATNNTIQAGLAFSLGGVVNGVQEDTIFTVPVTFASRF
jgi:hypothetical protein